MRLTIYPTRKQKALLLQTLGSQRWLFNHFLSLNIAKYDSEKKFIPYNKMSKLLPEMKKEYSWLALAPSQTLQQTLKRLWKAIRSVWELGFGFPEFKNRNRADDSATFPQNVKITAARIFLPVIGWMRCRTRNGIESRHIRTATVTYDRLRDRFLVSVNYDDEDAFLPATGRAVGIDAGSVRTYTDSDGDFLPAVRHYPHVEALLDKIRKAQARYSDITDKWKKCPDDPHIRRLRSRFRKSLVTLHRKLGNARKDILHKASFGLVRDNDLIVVEDLNLKGMTRSAKGTVENPGKNVSQKSGLNRNLLSNSIGTFFRFLEYKCLWNGRSFLKVNPKNTSRECPICGCVDADNRKSQAAFRCVCCGHEDNADHNAAVNILMRGLQMLESASAFSTGVWIASV